MKQIKILLVLALFVCCLTRDLNAQQPMNTNQSLDIKQQSIVTISAFTAKGDLLQLQQALNNGLDAGLTVNEIKEVLVQLYAYTGFPRSLNALQTFMEVLKKRKQKGIKDELGKAPDPLPANKTKLQLGTEIQTRLIGQPVKGEVFEFAPAIDQFLKEHLFGDIFGRDNLDWKTRELATISALASLGGVENQLRSHFGVGMYNGLTGAQLNHLVSIIKSKVGAKEGNAASEVLQAVLKQRQDYKATDRKSVESNLSTTENNCTIFPKGEKITNNNFIGNAWLQQMIIPGSLNSTQVGSVTFEPGARTNWHLHPAGQILLIIGGTGYYQEKGSPKRIIKKGDVINCPPNIPHWHGASKDDELIQIAITNTQKGAPVWLEAVTDEEYNK
ncbi:MAG: carboxymuconolactone decarboxylase family protein [Bacteroidota bacterium]|nr:carboxymuconolactone decarboxylase family protein [Bacteroidota bacterium]